MFHLQQNKLTEYKTCANKSSQISKTAEHILMEEQNGFRKVAHVQITPLE
jgi:hypothetical protein